MFYNSDQIERAKAYYSLVKALEDQLGIKLSSSQKDELFWEMVIEPFEHF